MFMKMILRHDDGNLTEASLHPIDGVITSDMVRGVAAVMLGETKKRAEQHFKQYQEMMQAEGRNEISGAEPDIKPTAT